MMKILTARIAAEMASAKATHDEASRGARLALWSLSHLLADDFAETDPNFNRNQFLKACNVT